MKYESPELIALAVATRIIQGGTRKGSGSCLENMLNNEIVPAYEDWA